MSTKKKPIITYMCDFETTVSDDTSTQEHTEVWATASVLVKTDSTEVSDEVIVTNHIATWFKNLESVAKYYNVIAYFHNLKFDGSFVIDYLLKQGYTCDIDAQGRWTERKFQKKKTIIPTISDMGQWYSITIKTKAGYRITLKDSFKLLPFSVDTIGKSFNTRHKKLSMDYVGDRQAGGTITDEEKEYIKNDVLVVKEALEFMFSEGHQGLTIGSCCKSEYLKLVGGKKIAKVWFPNLSKLEIDKSTYGSSTADEYIRKSYKGGWCYKKLPDIDKLTDIYYDRSMTAEEKQPLIDKLLAPTTVYEKGSTADGNSLYPSVMLDCKYPVGEPKFFEAIDNAIPSEALDDEHLYIIRIKTSFRLKKHHLPCIQIKGDYHYKPNEWLCTSDYLYKNQYFSTVRDLDGKVSDIRVELTLTETDFNLIKKHYDLYNLEILDGCYFKCMDGEALFGKYIHKWAEIKMTSTGAMRQLAKLFLNNLYGKFSAKKECNTKEPYIEDGVVKYKLVEDTDSDRVWYIAIGTFITSNARAFTISAAQKNYDIFLYADTDSIHCLGKPDDIKGIAIDDVKFSHWKIESVWDKAVFTRQKTYIEHIVQVREKGIYKDVKPYYDIKGCGMGKQPKNLIGLALQVSDIDDTDLVKGIRYEYYKDYYDKAIKYAASDLMKRGIEIAKDLTDREKDFVCKGLSLSDYTVGLTVPSNLKARVIDGGTLLRVSDFVIR